MIPKTVIYSVEITSDAFDDKQAWQYDDMADQLEDFTESDKVEEYKKKAVAFVRFKELCLKLQKGLDSMVEIKTEGADHLTLPTKLSFKLVYTQPDGLLREISEDEYEEDVGFLKTRDGRFFKTGEKAIEQLVKDVANAETHKVIANYWDPTCDEGNTAQLTPHGVVLQELEIPKAGEPSVTVTKLFEAVEKAAE